MSRDILELQRWLNIMGATPALVEDGIAGPLTQGALYLGLSNRSAPAVTDAQIFNYALRLGCSVRQIKAVAEVESAKSGFLSTGHPVILYERHYFWRRWQKKIPLLSDPKPGGYTLDADHDGVNDSWEKFIKAAMISPKAAFESVSWGKFQVMGAWWKDLGYSDVFSYGWSFRESEANHYEAFVRYVEFNKLQSALRIINSDPTYCLPFAEGYNGAGQKGYDVRIADAFRRLS